MFVERIPVNKKPEEFNEWLKGIKEAGMQYEVTIDQGFVQFVYVFEADDGDWSEMKFGKIVGSKEMSIKQKTYKPRIIGGKFINNYDQK